MKQNKSQNNQQTVKDTSIRKLMVTSIPKPRLDCDQSRVIFESERFDNLLYEKKDKHLIIYAGSNGALSVHFDRLPELIKDLDEINEAYGYELAKEFIKKERGIKSV